MSIFHRIKTFNQTFGLPTASVPVALPDLRVRLIRFKEIVTDEVREVDDIIAKLDANSDPLDILTDLADWLCDIQVYCASEAIRHGIDNEAILNIIMDSQNSKLVDGKPLVVNGKVQKGPDYAPPEPAIRQYIHALREAHGWASKEQPA